MAHRSTALTSSALASGAPLVVAPAMNNRMYEHPATQRNLELLSERGARIVSPIVAFAAGYVILIDFAQQRAVRLESQNERGKHK